MNQLKRVKQAKPVKQVNPAGRVDVLIERVADLLLTRFVETHPLHQRLKAAGADFGGLARSELSRKLKRARVTDLGSAVKALRRI